MKGKGGFIGVGACSSAGLLLDVHASAGTSWWDDAAAAAAAAPTTHRLNLVVIDHDRLAINCRVQDAGSATSAKRAASGSAACRTTSQRLALTVNTSVPRLLTGQHGALCGAVLAGIDAVLGQLNAQLLCRLHACQDGSIALSRRGVGGRIRRAVGLPLHGQDDGGM